MFLTFPVSTSIGFGVLLDIILAKFVALKRDTERRDSIVGREQVVIKIY
jgi:hypothetical protein